MQCWGYVQKIPSKQPHSAGNQTRQIDAYNLVYLRGTIRNSGQDADKFLRSAWVKCHMTVIRGFFMKVGASDRRLHTARNWSFMWSLIECSFTISCGTRQPARKPRWAGIRSDFFSGDSHLKPPVLSYVLPSASVYPLTR